MLRAGHPVKDYEEFESCDLILVCVPEETVPQVVSRTGVGRNSWQRQSRGSVQHLAGQQRIARSSPRGAHRLDPSVPIPGFDDQRYLVEGDPLAIRQSRSLVEYRDRRAVAIERSLKPFYLAALTCTGDSAVCLAPRGVRIVAARRESRRVFRRHCWNGSSRARFVRFSKAAGAPIPRRANSRDNCARSRQPIRSWRTIWNKAARLASLPAWRKEEPSDKMTAGRIPWNGVNY